MNYIFQRKMFWALWTTAFSASVMLLSVSIGTQIVYDIQTPITEPVWHLVLRWAHLLPEYEYKGIRPTLQPIIRHLPYIAIAYLVLSGTAVGIIWASARSRGIGRHNQAL